MVLQPVHLRKWTQYLHWALLSTQQIYMFDIVKIVVLFLITYSDLVALSNNWRYFSFLFCFLIISMVGRTCKSYIPLPSTNNCAAFYQSQHPHSPSKETVSLSVMFMPLQQNLFTFNIFTSSELSYSVMYPSVWFLSPHLLSIYMLILASLFKPKCTLPFSTQMALSHTYKINNKAPQHTASWQII